MDRRSLLASMLAAALPASSVVSARAQAAALPSWQEGPAKASIMEFVARVTRPNSPDFVLADERIAVFDNDGTLWCEQPIYSQLAFALDQVKLLAPAHPEWQTQEPFKSVLANDLAGVVRSGEQGIFEIMTVTHAGMATDEFDRAVMAWTRTARHPRYHRGYTELVFQPMLELLEFLRQSDFKIFVVSGGGIDFMRPWMQAVYGIPPERVVGSSGMAKYVVGADGRPALIKDSKIDFVDDGPGKPVGIHKFIGRRPIFAFGNSDGDLQMLQWTAAGSGARFMGIVHHTDADREYAYDRNSSVGKLDKAWDEAMKERWIVVDMKQDWKVVFPS
ncbi:haloacid dehalogenase-like hydrolase [Mesorhizobium sp. M0615]|uniref:HAD family hydrolase n=1 Tax=Mesorhizobium sp. M0615 TaxID=2956971 RepID=UPI00333691D2